MKYECRISDARVKDETIDWRFLAGAGYRLPALRLRHATSPADRFLLLSSCLKWRKVSSDVIVYTRRAEQEELSSRRLLPGSSSRPSAAEGHSNGQHYFTSEIQRFWNKLVFGQLNVS